MDESSLGIGSVNTEVWVRFKTKITKSCGIFTTILTSFVHVTRTKIMIQYLFSIVLYGAKYFYFYCSSSSLSNFKPLG